MVKAKLLERNEGGSIDRKLDVEVIEEVEASTAHIKFLDGGCEMMVDMNDLEMKEEDRKRLVIDRMSREKRQEDKLRKDDLESELQEIEDRKLEIYKELGREIYNIQVEDVLKYAESEEGTEYVNEYHEGRDSAFAQVSNYINQFKVEENV